VSRGRGRGRRRKRNGRETADGTIARLQMALLVAVLLAAGVLIGSFLIEWRHTRLAGPAEDSVFSGTPRGVEAPTMPNRVRLEVLNGVGAYGAAKRVGDRLRALGFDVVYAGNARSFDVERSYLVDRSGRLGVARAVADSVGLDSLSVALDPELHLDATVVLGADWERLLTPPEPESRTGWLERILRRFRD
jgi:hypothetical protein